MYTLLLMNPYKYVTTTFMRCVLNTFKSVKRIKNENMIASMKRVYIFSYLILSLCEKSCVTNCSL